MVVGLQPLETKTRLESNPLRCRSLFVDWQYIATRRGIPCQGTYLETTCDIWHSTSMWEVWQAVYDVRHVRYLVCHKLAVIMRHAVTWHDMARPDTKLFSLYAADADSPHLPPFPHATWEQAHVMPRVTQYLFVTFVWRSTCFLFVGFVLLRVTQYLSQAVEACAIPSVWPMGLRKASAELDVPPLVVPRPLSPRVLR